MIRTKNMIRLALAIACALSAGSLLADEEEGWITALKAMPGYHSNYFFRGPGIPAPDTTLFSLYGTGEKERKTGSGKFTFLFDVGLVFVQDIDDADYYDINLGGEYKRKATKYSAEIFARPNQVFDEEGVGVLFDLTGVELGVRQTIGTGRWIGFKWELESWDFDQAEDERDATSNTFDLSVRFPLSEGYGLRGTVVWDSKEADNDRFSWEGPGVAVALEGQPSDRLQLFFRYKYREREYKDAPPDTSNFGREDEVQDIVFNISWLLTDSWGIRLEDFYRDGSSTRPDRNYDGNRIYAGVIYRF